LTSILKTAIFCFYSRFKFEPHAASKVKKAGAAGGAATMYEGEGFKNNMKLLTDSLVDSACSRAPRRTEAAVLRRAPRASALTHRTRATPAPCM
jgi:hypothetical protein